MSVEERNSLSARFAEYFIPFRLASRASRGSSVQDLQVIPVGPSNLVLGPLDVLG